MSYNPDADWAKLLRNFGGAEAGRRFDERSERYLYPERVAAREETARRLAENEGRLAALAQLSQEAMSSFMRGIEKIALAYPVFLFGTAEQQEQARALLRGP